MAAREESQRRGLDKDTPSHVEYYKEPFTKVENGYGYEGVLTISDEDTHVQCHMCGRFYVSLGTHVAKEHNLPAREYKKRFGLRLTYPLASPKYRKQLKNKHSNASLATKAKRYTNLQKGAEALKNTERKPSVYSLENKNLKGSCPEQLLDKVKTVFEKYESDASVRTFREEYGQGMLQAVYRTYGSWVNAVTLAGYQVNPGGGRTMTKDQFIMLARDFYDRHKLKPSYRDFVENKSLPSIGVLYKLFGSFNNATQETFNGYAEEN